MNLRLLSKKTLVLFLFALIFHNSRAQENYSLLWRIDHKDLPRSSYLFGTMHVKDARAFNFSDSVMVSIEKCDNFAMEVHPDTMVRHLFTNMFDSKEVIEPEELLDSSDYERLKEKFETENGYELDQVKVKSPVILKSLLNPSESKPDDKSTFVDAHLYGIAKTLNKKIFGLEDVQVQIDMFNGKSPESQKAELLELIDSDKDVYKIELEVLTQIYEEGDVDVIESFVGSSGLEDSLMISRNTQMTESIIDLMKKGSTFSAVGTAHLPGRYGIIELLRAQGYVVTQVEASFTGVAQNYKVDVQKMKWVTYSNKEYGYSIEIPNKPFKLDFIPILDMQLYPDLTDGSYYGLMTMHLPTGEQYNEDELIKTIIQTYKKDEATTVISKKRIVKDGDKAFDILLEKGSVGQIRMQLFVKNSTLYGAYVGHGSNNLESPIYNRFFNSFKSFKKSSPTESDWIEFKNSNGAFSCLVPVQPKPSISETSGGEDSEPYKINMFMSLSLKDNANYIIAYNDFPVGYYLEDPDSGLQELVKVLAKSGSSISEVDTIWKDGFPGRKFNMLLNDQFYCEIEVYARGNRYYKFIRQSFNKMTPSSDDPFLGSLSFEPYASCKFADHKSDELKIAFKQFPLKKYDKDSSTEYDSYIEEIHTFDCTNPESGGVYVLQVCKLKEFTHILELDTFYKRKTDEYISWKDSIVEERKVFVDSVACREVFVKSGNSGSLKRMRIWAKGGYYYLNMGLLSKDEVYSDDANKYFNSFTFLPGHGNFGLSKSKTKDILKALKSTDTTDFKNALGAIDYNEYEINDLPLFYEALKENYPDDTSFNGVKCKIIENIGIINDSSSISFLVNLYSTPNTTDQVKYAIIQALVDFDTPLATEAYIKVFFQDPPKDIAKYHWKMFVPFRDSLTLIQNHFHELLPLLDNDQYKNDILSLAIDLLNGDSSQIKLVMDNFDRLTSLAMTDLARYKEDLGDQEYLYQREMYSYFTLMYKVTGRKVSDKYTDELLGFVKNNWLVTQALRVRIVNNLDVNKSLVKKNLKSDYYRYEIMEAYNEADKLSEVPSKYLRREGFAKLCLFNYLTNDDEPEEIELLGEVELNGDVYYCFKFNYNYGEKTDYFGIVGPFEKGNKKLNFNVSRVEYTNWDEVQVDWKKQAKEAWGEFSER